MTHQLDDGDDEKSIFKAFVGIDFGTDGSGLAYGLPDGSAYIHNMWDDTEATRKPKTSVLFDSSNSVLKVGSEAQNLYLKCTGDQGWKLFERFKMSLYEEPKSKSDLRKAETKMEYVELKEKIISTNNTSIVEDSSKVFIEELKHLKKEAFKFIETHFKQKLKLKGNSEVGWSEIQYFLTVPAIWSEKAKNQMIQWAIKAGLISGQIKNQLRIVYEPDCASLSIHHAILRKLEEDCKQSDAKPNKIDVTKYLQWSSNDIVDWILSLEQGKYKNYEKKLRAEINDEGVDGSSIKDIEKSDIKGWGVNNLKDRTSIYKHLQQLLNPNKNATGNNDNDNKKLNPLQPQVSIDVALKKGDKYILLDVGGGTCDVACHEVMGNDKKTGKFCIAEVFHPSGGSWGATSIDDEFIKLLGKLFTRDLLDIFQMTQEDGRISYLSFLSHFLNDAKLTFHENQNKKYSEYHDIQMPATFVRFVATQYNKMFQEGKCSLSINAILLDLNKRLHVVGKKYINPHWNENSKPAAAAGGENITKISNPTDDNEGDNSDNDMNEPERDWMIKIIEAPGNDQNIKEHYLLSMHVDIWNKMFNVIINPIVAHCKQILRAKDMNKAKYLFIVGGFANSKYFQMRMKKEFGGYNNLNVVLPDL
eukprot:548040_1